MAKKGSLGRPGIRPRKRDGDAGDPQRLLRRAELVHEVGAEAAGRRSLGTRVTMMPVATEMSSAGIWETRPSPTDSRQYGAMASPIGRPCCSDADRDAADQVDDDDDDARRSRRP